VEEKLLRSLMDYAFQEEYNTFKCPDVVFSKEGQKIKKAIEDAVTFYKRSLTPSEVEAIYYVNNPTLTTSQKAAVSDSFHKIAAEAVIGKDVAQDLLSKMFQQYIGEEIANLGFDYINGNQNSLDSLSGLLEKYESNFIPKITVTWDNLSFDEIIEQTLSKPKWQFNISSLQKRVTGVDGGQLIEVGARSNVGKTSFHASLVAGPNGFAEQGAKVLVLCNEEPVKRVLLRYVLASGGFAEADIMNNYVQATAKYNKIKDNIFFKDVTEYRMDWVDSICRSYNPDIVVLDMGDKLANMAGHSRVDEALKANAIFARRIAKRHDCAMFYMSQLSAEAEGKIVLNQSMMEGSKTGKAAEADLMLLLAKNPQLSDQAEEDNQRHINISKNKLTGWHGIVHCEFDYKTSRYTA
jgi:replicative DNA helicase